MLVRYTEKTAAASVEETMAAKLGLNEVVKADDESLLTELHEVLQLAETDMTIFFRGLAAITAATPPGGEPDQARSVLPVQHLEGPLVEFGALRRGLGDGMGGASRAVGARRAVEPQGHGGRGPGPRGLLPH